MVGTNDALCVDWRVMGSGDIAGVCGTEVEVLTAMSLFIVYDMEGKRIPFGMTEALVRGAYIGWFWV